MNRYAESLRDLARDANHRGLCVTESMARLGAEEIDRLEQIVSSQATELELMQAAVSRVVSAAMPHRDPLSSEGADVNYYMIPPRVYAEVSEAAKRATP